MQVRVAAVIHVNTVVCDGAEGVFLDKVHKVVLGGARHASGFDMLRRDRREERKLVLHIQVGDRLGVFRLERVVPTLEVGPRSGKHVRNWGGEVWDNRRVVVRDLPHAVHVAPHIREARLHWRPRVCVAQLEGVQAGVQVGVSSIVHVDGVVCDGAKRVLLNELDEVALGAAGFASRFDVLGRHSGKEGKLVRHIHVGDRLSVLGLERVVPALEVGPREDQILWLASADASRISRSGCGRWSVRLRGIRRGCGLGYSSRHDAALGALLPEESPESNKSRRRGKDLTSVNVHHLDGGAKRTGRRGRTARHHRGRGRKDRRERAGRCGHAQEHRAPKHHCETDC